MSHVLEEETALLVMDFYSVFCFDNNVSVEG